MYKFKNAIGWDNHNFYIVAVYTIYLIINTYRVPNRQPSCYHIRGEQFDKPIRCAIRSIENSVTDDNNNETTICALSRNLHHQLTQFESSMHPPPNVGTIAQRWLCRIHACQNHFC